MSRRVKLPGADELFRPTEPGGESERPVERPLVAVEALPAETPDPTESAEPAPQPPEATKGPSGRVRHDEKITVYVTADELLDLEHTRLTVRRDHGLAVDRGRFVREAIHLALESVGRDGGDSALVRRLRET
jgi:hypothetical protein